MHYKYKIPWYLWPLLAAIPLLMAFRRRGWAPLVEPLKLRSDSSGYGEFGQSRDGGSRDHRGYDLLVQPGQNIYSPFDGKAIRYSNPYPQDSRYTGILIQPIDLSYKVKIFYMIPTPGIIGQNIQRGQLIGTAQSVRKKYGGSMQDHIHVEVIFTENGQEVWVDPAPYIYGEI